MFVLFNNIIAFIKKILGISPRKSESEQNEYYAKNGPVFRV